MGEDETSVTRFFESFADTWKTNDGAALADFFTDDGTLINPFGERADGRSSVGTMYGEYFGGILEGTTTTITLERLRAVERTHALVDAHQPIYAPNGEVLLVANLVALLQRDADTWKFVDARPYTTPPAP